MDEIWQQLQTTDSHLEGTERDAAGQRSRLKALNRELDALNRTVSHLRNQMGSIAGANFNGKKNGGHCPCQRSIHTSYGQGLSFPSLQLAWFPYAWQSLSIASWGTSGRRSRQSSELRPRFEGHRAPWAKPNTHTTPPLSC